MTNVNYIENTDRKSIEEKRLDELTELIESQINLHKLTAQLEKIESPGETENTRSVMLSYHVLLTEAMREVLQKEL